MIKRLHLLLEITWTEWALAIGLSSFLLFVLLTLKKIAVRKLKKHASVSVTSEHIWLDLIQATRPIFLFVVSWYAGLNTLDLHPSWHTFLDRTVTLILLLQFWIWSMVGLNFWITHYLKKKSKSDAASATTIGLISFVVKFVLFILVALLALNNLGINITALVAGLGIGGIAVALALQNILGDLFASLTIVLDQPFIIGDSISVGDFSGTIEHIGLKTTRIRSVSGEQVVFANGDLLKSRIRNFKRMEQRRVQFTLRVPYLTSTELLREIPPLVKQSVETQKDARFEYCHLLKFGESALEFEVVYWIQDASYKVYAEATQQINLKILEQFRIKKIEFSYIPPAAKPPKIGDSSFNDSA